jgi:hypothetical protein
MGTRRRWYFNMEYEYFKLKCEKDYVSVLALRGMGTKSCRQTTRKQTKKANNQEETPE